MDEENNLVSFIRKIKEKNFPCTINEMSEIRTKSYIIEPILEYLGWNKWDIMPERVLDTGRVDYSLQIDKVDKVFIEAKQLSSKLDNENSEQLLKYAFTSDIDIAVLTNGLTWELFLSRGKGKWHERKFYTINLEEQDVEKAAENLLRFIGKESIITESAVSDAQGYHSNRRKNKIIEEALPETWKKIIEEPDIQLALLLANRVEQTCGYKPSDKKVMSFIKDILSPQLQHETRKIKRGGTPTLTKGKMIVSGVPGKKRFLFRLLSESHEVIYSWEILVKILGIMAKLHPTRFEEIASQEKGHKRKYFMKSFTEDERRDYQLKEVPGTNWFVNTKYGIPDMIKQCYKYVKLFGYGENDLEIS